MESKSKPHWRRLQARQVHPRRLSRRAEDKVSEWQSDSPEATHQFGIRLGSLLQPGVVTALHGDLGAGKTALTQGIARGLGVTQRVTSPTFTLVNRYPTAGESELVHIDCYRLGEGTESAVLEAKSIGLDEILADSRDIVVVEWAGRVAPLLPPDHLQINLIPVEGDAQARHLMLLAHGPQSQQVLQALLDLSDRV